MDPHALWVQDDDIPMDSSLSLRMTVKMSSFKKGGGPRSGGGFLSVWCVKISSALPCPLSEKGNNICLYEL